MMALFAAGLYLFSRARMMDLARVRLEDGYRQIAIVLIRSEGDLMDLNHLSSALPFRLTRDGRTRYEKQGWRDLPWPPTENEGLPIQPDGFSWKTTDGRYFHIHKGIIPEYNYILEYVEEYTEVENNLALLRMFLLLGIPLSLIPAILGGSLLARGALSPVREISRKAEEMGAENLSERLPVQNPGDEIGQLTKVFNDLLFRLQSSFDRLRRFTADASHELRTPLTSLRSVGQVALQGNRGEAEYRNAVSSMLEETEKLTHLIDNLLTLSRGDAHQMALRPTSQELGGFVEEIVEELRILSEEKNQALVLDLSSPVTAFFDPPSLRMAVMNVLHNAIRQTPEYGEIRIATGQPTKQAAQLDICDSGPGIPPDEREKVFERFYRLDKARSRNEGGTGLGLAIARWAVISNHGKILFVDRRRPGDLLQDDNSVIPNLAPAQPSPGPT